MGPGCTRRPWEARGPHAARPRRPALRRRRVPPPHCPLPPAPLRSHPPRPARTRPCSYPAPLPPPLSPGLPAPPSRPRPCRSPQPGSVAEERPERSAAQLNRDTAATAGTCRPTPGALMRDGPREVRAGPIRERALSKGPKEVAERANRKGLEAGLRGRVRRALKAPHSLPLVGWRVRRCPWDWLDPAVSVLPVQGRLCPLQPDPSPHSPTSQPAVSALPSCTHRHTPPGLAGYTSQELCTACGCKARQLIIEGDPIISSCGG